MTDDLAPLAVPLTQRIGVWRGLLPGLEARIVAVDTSGMTPIVEMEVSDG